MAVTLLIKCDCCPNTIADDAEGATFVHGWSKCRESDLWRCACCMAIYRMHPEGARCGNGCVVAVAS